MREYKVIEIRLEPLDLGELDKYSEEKVRKIGFKRSGETVEQYEYAYDLDLTSFRIPLEEIPYLIGTFQEGGWELFSANGTYHSQYHYHVLYYQEKKAQNEGADLHKDFKER